MLLEVPIYPPVANDVISEGTFITEGSVTTSRPRLVSSVTVEVWLEQDETPPGVRRFPRTHRLLLVPTFITKVKETVPGRPIGYFSSGEGIDSWRVFVT